MNVKRVVKLVQRIQDAEARVAALHQQLREEASPGAVRAKTARKRKYTRRAKPAEAGEKPARARKAKAGNGPDLDLKFPKPKRGRPRKSAMIPALAPVQPEAQA